MKVAPEKSYEVRVEFDEVVNRWYARFSHVKHDVQYSFPLADVPSPAFDANRALTNERPTLTSYEEGILALVFSQMVSVVQSARAKQAAMVRALQGAGAPKAELSETEKSLTTP